jgi:SAM-dependent methyltransferase
MTATREEIEEFFRTAKLYQSIEIDGIRAKGCSFESQEVLKRMKWPDDMTGKSFLDVGSNAGFYVFEARERGAAPCVGIDREADQIKKAERIAQLKGLDQVKFYKMNALDLEQLGMTFNISSMLSVFHHLHEPLKVLRLIHNLTTERFYGEFYTLPKDDPPERKGARRYAVDRIKEFVEKTHVEYPTPWGMAEMLREVGWKEVNFLGAGKNANRILFQCEK